MSYLRGPYERSGPPSIWGDSLVHEDIEGHDDQPVWVGEAKGPVTPPSSGFFDVKIGDVLLVGGGLLLLAAVAFAPADKLPGGGHLKDARANPRRRSRRARRSRRRAA